MKNTVIFFLLLSASFYPGKVAAQPSYRDSLWKEIRAAKDDRTRILNMSKLSFDYRHINPDSAFLLGLQAYRLAQSIGYHNGEALSLNRIAGTYVTIGEYATALSLFIEAKSIYERIGDTDGIHKTLNNIGDMYMEYEDWAEALHYVLQAKAILASQIRQKSLEHDTAALYSLSIKLQNIGECYFNLHRLDSALWYERQALQMAKESDAGTEGGILRIIAEAKLQSNNMAEAFASLQESIAYDERYDNSLGLSSSYRVMGKYYNSLGKRDSALFYTQASLRAAETANYRKGLLKAGQQLASILEASNNFQEAARYYRQVIAINDSLFAPQKVKQMLTVNFGEYLRQLDVEKAKTEERRKIRTVALLSIISVFFLLAVILYRNNRQKQKVNAVLQQQKEKVEATLASLKATQAQLVQKEKMASLGQLTAGIAHEIQNPLNFVNNFSELSKEQVEELESELMSGKSSDAIALIKDVKQNFEKVLYHSRRADAIVKGMLQHSRPSTSEKQLTDLNALCEEYLRLTYHGQQARDKSTSVNLQTCFDENIGMVEIVPQEIGRVMINLYNNAFYAVREKAETEGETYKPMVKVSTRKTKGKATVHVEDNGTGIPQHLCDRIFQPFFTTKPSGHGTGLGLSISYDIVVKGHGGDLKVKSNEGEGTEFIVELPG